MLPPPLPCVATFIVPDEDLKLDRHIEHYRDLLPDAGSTRWLDPGRAADVEFSIARVDLPKLRQAAAAHRPAGLALDVILQPRDGRRKRLFLADMDSTMIEQECIDELADFVGLKPLVAGITERTMRGDLTFEPALRERVGLLKGLAVDVVDKVLHDRITLTPGGRTLVQTLRSNGVYSALLSGGFTLFTGPVAARLGFDEHRGNSLLVENERFSGLVADPILGREAKLATLVELRERLGLSRDDTLAVGDGANDLGMIGEAGLGIAYHAKPAVAAAAGGRIDHNDLSALLFAQGYGRQEFVRDPVATGRD